VAPLGEREGLSLVAPHLEQLFPGLQGTAYRVTSPPDPAYNCIAWAVGLTRGWWWPFTSHPDGYWPPGVVEAVTLDAFRDALATRGYAPCQDETHEPGFEKVAIFADAHGTPTHAARQLSTGRWTSKVGFAEDIEHDLRDVEGQIYGTVVLVMKRSLAPSPGAAASLPSTS
jgi:hypothetical protein